MRIKTIGIFAGFALGVMGITVLALPLLAQKDFNMDEKKLIECFKRANPLYLDGANQFAKGALDKAEKKLLAALAIMPEHADAYYVLAQIHLKRKELPQALDSITVAEKNYAANAQFHTFTYQQYLDRLRQQRQELEAQRTQIMDLLSRQPAGSRNRSTNSQATQFIDQSIQQIDSRLSSPVPPTFEVPAEYFYIHGNVFYQMGRPLDAAAQYREAIRLDPRLGSAYNNLALVLFSQGNYQEALDCLSKAEGTGVKINPDFKKAVEAKIAPK
jgi:tetratricopeptide (TPR) repeat protein